MHRNPYQQWAFEIWSRNVERAYATRFGKLDLWCNNAFYERFLSAMAKMLNL